MKKNLYIRKRQIKKLKHQHQLKSITHSNPTITKNINIETFLEETSIKMDKTKTQKLINNLVSNAIKYSKKDSKIIVRLNNNIFEVQDFGIGIDEKEQKNIFKRYKRGENIEGGFGIGLDIVKRICEEYNLVLDLKSQINEGSIFSVEFSSVVEN